MPLTPALPAAHSHDRPHQPRAILVPITTRYTLGNRSHGKIADVLTEYSDDGKHVSLKCFGSLFSKCSQSLCCVINGETPPHRYARRRHTVRPAVGGPS